MTSAPTVHIAHDWLDYFEAIGGLVGGAAALAALVFAGISKRDAGRSAGAAERSAAAAEESLRIWREEAEAARTKRSLRAVPTIRLDAHFGGGAVNDVPSRIVLWAGFSNDGQRDAERVVVNIVVPDSLTIAPCMDEFGLNSSQRGLVRKLPDARLGEHTGGVFWSDDVGPVDVAVSKLLYFVVTPVVAGDHVIETTIAHADLPGRGTVANWLLRVSGALDAVEITQSE